MSDSEMVEQLLKHDSGNMADLTRSFVEDFRRAINRETGVE